MKEVYTDSDQAVNSLFQFWLTGEFGWYMHIYNLPDINFMPFKGKREFAWTQKITKK